MSLIIYIQTVLIAVEAPQTVGPHLLSKLFDTLVIFLQIYTKEYFCIILFLLEHRVDKTYQAYKDLIHIQDSNEVYIFIFRMPISMVTP